MSEHLKTDLDYAAETLQSARDWDCQPGNNQEIVIANLIVAMQHLISHLEAQQETPASASQPTEQPAPSSSEDMTTQQETQRIGSISFESWCRANPDGSLTLYPSSGMWGLCSSHLLHGVAQAEVVGVTLTSKASTPPAGSPSPSTEEPTQEGNGHAGNHDNLDGPCACGAWHSPASSPEPAQGGSEGWPHCKASGWVDGEATESLLVQCDQKPGHIGDHYDSSVGRSFSSRTMKEGSERG